MNASNESQRCKSDASYCKFGSEALLKLLQVFKTQIEGVEKNKDIEYVHRMRVSSRRLRAAMPLFRTCYSKKKFKKWLKEIKKVTKLLGEARDLDVQIVFIQDYLQKVNSPSENSGLLPLLKNHKDRRKAIQSTVTNGLRSCRIQLY